MKKNYVLWTFALVVVISGAILMYQNRKSPGSLTSGPIQQKSADESSFGTGKEVVVELLEGGYSPEEVTIKRGDVVKFVNKRKHYFWPASNLHPTHTIYPEFDPQEPVESSWSFRFNKVGEWRYHDHLAPYFTGKVKVIE